MDPKIINRQVIKIDYPKPVGISLVGWAVSIGNILLFVSYYYIFLTQQTPAPPQFIKILAMVAVFPEDFFLAYLSSSWMVHFCWMFVVTISAFGILLLNSFARKVFIVMNIVHGAILTYIVIMHYGQADFMEYIFKLYFNYTFIFAYLGFVTIPEVRVLFKPAGLFIASGRSPAGRKVVPDAQGYYHLALAYSRLHRVADAVMALQKAIGINAEDDRYHYELGLLYIKQKHSAAAIQALKEAVRINPAHFQAIFQLGGLYQLEGCGREAVMFLEKAAGLQPGNAQVFRQLGKAHMLTENYPAAVESLEKALHLNTRDPEIHYQLGWIYLNKLGKFEEAKNALRSAIQLKPEFLDAHFQMGMACIKLNRYKDALRAFKDVVYREEDHKQAHYQMGFVYVMLKDLDSARREYQAVHRVDPDLAERLRMLISAGMS